MVSLPRTREACGLRGRPSRRPRRRGGSGGGRRAWWTRPRRVAPGSLSTTAPSASIATEASVRFGGCCERWTVANSYRPMRWLATTTAAGTEASCSRTAAISLAIASTCSRSSGPRSLTRGSADGAGASSDRSTGCSPPGVQRLLMAGSLAGVCSTGERRVPVRSTSREDLVPVRCGTASLWDTTEGKAGSSPPGARRACQGLLLVGLTGSTARAAGGRRGSSAGVGFPAPAVSPFSEHVPPAG